MTDLRIDYGDLNNGGKEICTIRWSSASMNCAKIRKVLTPDGKLEDIEVLLYISCGIKSLPDLEDLEYIIYIVKSLKIAMDEHGYNLQPDIQPVITLIQNRLDPRHPDYVGNYVQPNQVQVEPVEQVEPRLKHFAYTILKNKTNGRLRALLAEEYEVGDYEKDYYLENNLVQATSKSDALKKYKHPVK